MDGKEDTVGGGGGVTVRASVDQPNVCVHTFLEFPNANLCIPVLVFIRLTVCAHTVCVLQSAAMQAFPFHVMPCLCYPAPSFSAPLPPAGG